MSLMADEDRDLERAALEERAAVVAWLRAEAAQRAHKGQVWRLAEIEALEFAADAIERGEHLKGNDR